jgi:hypothetical protein
MPNAISKMPASGLPVPPVKPSSGRQFLRSRKTFLAGALGGLLIVLGGCVTPEQQALTNQTQDQNACVSMGAAYGTPSFTHCMLQQQERRDEAHLRFLKEAEINSKLARDAQIMREKRKKEKD